MGLQK